jgi:uncharacterized membrane protein
MQALIVASAIFPLYKLCRLKKIPNIATLFILTAFAFYPALSGGCMYDIHENMFLTAFMMWLFYFIERATDESDGGTFKSWLGVYGFALLTFTVKEDAPIYIAVIAVYLVFAKKRVAHGVVLFLLAVTYFATALWLLDEFGKGLMLDSRHQIFTGGDGIRGVIATILTNPAFILRQSISEGRLYYILQMLLPVALIPLICANKKFASLLLLIPFILKNLMPTWPYHHDIGFQYHFGVTAIFFYLFVINFAALESAKLKKFVLTFAVTASIFLFTGLMWQRISIIERYSENASNIAVIREVLAEIPVDEGAVAATTFLIPPLSSVHELYELNTRRISDAEFLVIDLRWPANKELLEIYAKHGYTLHTHREGLIAVMVRG